MGRGLRISFEVALWLAIEVSALFQPVGISVALGLMLKLTSLSASLARPDALCKGILLSPATDTS